MIKSHSCSSLNASLSTCNHCDGKGYLELRDCSGEVQREENCTFCDGTGQVLPDDEES